MCDTKQTSFDVRNAANELTKMNDPYGGETTFTYDGFGRMVTKALEAQPLCFLVRHLAAGGTGELLFRYRSADVANNGYCARICPVWGQGERRAT